LRIEIAQHGLEDVKQLKGKPSKRCEKEEENGENKFDNTFEEENEEGKNDDIGSEQLQNRPSEHPFLQQTLPRWQEPLSPKIIIITLFVVSVAFFLLGGLVIVASQSSFAYVITYDGHLASSYGLSLSTPAAKASKPTKIDCSIGPYDTEGRVCYASFVTEKDLKPPIYVSYLLTNMYQNYYTYAHGRSIPQLSGTSLRDTGECRYYTSGGYGKTYYPCGLAARSMFNDSFSLTQQHHADSKENISSSSSSRGMQYTIHQENIAWKSDLEKYHNIQGYPSMCGIDAVCLNESYPQIENILQSGVRNQHFITWNHIAALPDFVKRWGRIEQDIPKGTNLTFRIEAKFPVSSFGGSKSLVLATNSWIGGRNVFLGITYLVMASLCFFTALIFTAKQRLAPREMGSVELLRRYEGHNSAL